MPGTPLRIDPATAAGMLADWGFLAHSDLPDRPGPSWLLVAIRPRPTRTHFDPEAVDYWVTDGDRGVGATLDARTHLPLAAATTWGTIRVTDRLRVTNEWLTFGGTLVAERVDDAIVAVFASGAPLLRRGGHSQGWDEGAANLGAFFAKARAAAGSDRRFEAAAAAADPVARYACFVGETMRRFRVSEMLRRLEADLWRLLAHEEHRLRATAPDAWASGLRLLDLLDGAATAALMGDAGVT